MLALWFKDEGKEMPTDNQKVKVFWGTPERDAHGNALGYNTHNAQMLKNTLPFLDNDPQAKVVLQIISGDKFVPVPGRINVIFSMWEFLDVPESYKEALGKADYVIVPSSFCKEIFAPYCKRKPIVCWEGVDPSVYTYKERKAGEKFRFLWVGAPNPRKGYQSILQVIKLADMYPKLEFYLKTTVKKITFMQTVKQTIKHWDRIKDVEGGLDRIKRIFQRIPSGFNAEKVFCYGKNKNIFVDTRKLPTDDLVALYHSANCFLFPTLGEGWGLTLSEAMATGLPCISADKTGCADFFDNSVGYVIDTEIKDLGELPNYGLKSCRAYVPSTQNLLDLMDYVSNNYAEALKRGKRASERMRTQFTWERSGKRLADILSKIVEVEGDKINAVENKVEAKV